MPVPSASATAAAAGISHAVVERQLSELRSKTLKWSPRESPLQRVALVGNKVYSQLRDAIVVADLASRGDAQRVVAKGPHQLARLADGDVLAVGVANAFVIASEGGHAQGLRKVMLMPQERLFGSVGNQGQFDAFDPGAGRWSSYSFHDTGHVTSVWLPETQFDVPELAHGHCGQLLDGTYACFARDQLWHLVSRSRPKLVGNCAAGLPAWRVLGTARADQVWLARVDGSLERWWLAVPPKRLSTVQLPWTPLDVDVQGSTIAVIRVAQERETTKNLSLVVMDTQGRLRFEQSLMPTHDDEPSRTESDLLQAEVVVHPHRPWVALRSSAGTRVLDSITGETLYQLQ